MKKLLFVLLCFIPLCVNAEELNLAKSAKSAILIEASTGEIIFSKDPDAKLAPASMTKIMTMLLVMEHIEKGVLTWDEMVTVSENARKMGGSQILLETGEKMSVEDLFKGLAIASGNDAAVALAEKIAGSEEIFVNMMNERAGELGLKNTNFKNPHGLDTANHYSSARDMSIMARELVKHEKVLEFTGTYDTYLRENLKTKIWLVNTNKLVKFYQGVDGLKTGFTSGAGYCITTTAKRDNMRLIAVTMGTNDSITRNKEITEMLDYTFAQYKTQVIMPKEQVLNVVPIEIGKSKTVKVRPINDSVKLSRKIDKNIEVTYKAKYEKIKAPVKVGDVVGKVKIYHEDKIIDEIDLTVQEDIEKINFFELYLRNIYDTIKGEL